MLGSHKLKIYATRNRKRSRSVCSEKAIRKNVQSQQFAVDYIYYARTHAKNARTRAKITISGRRGRSGRSKTTLYNKILFTILTQ